MSTMMPAMNRTMPRAALRDFLPALLVGLLAACASAPQPRMQRAAALS